MVVEVRQTKAFPLDSEVGFSLQCKGKIELFIQILLAVFQKSRISGFVLDLLFCLLNKMALRAA